MLRRYGCRGLQYRPGILIFDGTLYGRGAYTETAMTKKLTFALLALGLLACAPRPAGPVDYVDPFIGTGYHGVASGSLGGASILITGGKVEATGGVSGAGIGAGIYSNTIRLSIGTENIDDIIEDLEGSFQSV